MPSLLERHAELLRSGPVRARDAAQRLGTTEAALVACGATGTATPLKNDWGALFAALPRLGRIMALTRNEHAVHERHGAFVDVSAGPGHILVLGPDIDLRLFPGQWAHAYALGGERPSIQIFDKDGAAAHKIFATKETDRAAWDTLVTEFTAPLAALPPMTPPEPAAPVAEVEVDQPQLRADWQALKDTHDFFPMLRKHKANRRQAFRLVGDDHALRLPPSVATATLQAAATGEVPIMIFVGNRSAIQIHTGPVTKLLAIPGWFNVLDPDFNLHLREAGVAEVWRVVKPTVDGDVTSIELLDEAGEVIAMIFGARKPGQPEREDWRALVAQVATTPWPSERAA
ncbi:MULTISPECIES: hemin-degrading factor [Roseomonadaceae]|uniref:Hemin-degrading factor n=1 Tax=Falsiroseomonas oleicola TaxID=2801474 RepID=A0ABS6H8C1_9PROT|nr:ChuX/HutX family heme-like substrate-binding protein [Roseomonas oleicola]MBU8544957.1 hemin-degrading factor [Roseomonas oleicola]